MRCTMTSIAALAAGTLLTAAPALAQGYGPTGAPQQNITEPGPGQAQADPAQNPNAIKTHVPKISRGAAKAIGELQKAVNANATAEIPAKVAAAQAEASTADDRYAIAMLQLKAAAAAKDNSAIAQAIEAMLASGAATPEEKLPLYLNLAQTYTALKAGDRASQAYQQVLQLDPNSVDATAGMAEALVAQGQAAQGIALLEKGIALQSAGGAKAPELWYKRAVSVGYKAKLPQTVELSRKWIAAYPTTDAWQNGLAIYQNFGQLDETRTLDLLRLKRATKTLSPADYFNYGDIAVRKGMVGEAKAVLEEGFAANKVSRSNSSFSQLYALASQRTSGDRASLPAAPEAGANARQTLNSGDAWFGYGDYAKALEFYRAALGKEGADANLINLHIGMALARQGDKAGAVTALNSVTGPNAELAKFWLLFAQASA